MNIEVVCALILRNGCVLCAQRSERMALPLKWEFPGGKLEPNELPEAALKREILEELGVEIEIVSALQVSEYSYDGVRTIRLIPFLACIIDNNEPKAHEHSEIRWVPNSELMQLDWAAADVPIVQQFVRETATGVDSNR
jgi:8-oxo-dGTP diphosphatase